MVRFTEAPAFVGRQWELSQLMSAWDDAVSGHGRLVMLAGEPGIGKTRLGYEFAQQARVPHERVLRGRCYEALGTPSFRPWVEALRQHILGLDSERLRSELGTEAEVLADIIPEVKVRIPGLSAAKIKRDPTAARFRLFDAITTFLKNTCQVQPLMLVLDDLHWADESSLLLLQFVATQLEGIRLLILGMYRDVEVSRAHPLTRTLGELTRESTFRRLQLRGLAQEEVNRFIEQALGGDVPEEFRQSVYARTQGNPLFMRELMRLVTDELAAGYWRDPGFAYWKIPDGVRELIGRRLDRVSGKCHEILRVAAVFGREFALDHLAHVLVDISADSLLDMIEQAINGYLIEEVEEEAGRYRFTHALIQETLLDELSSGVKVRWHARIAEALEQLYGTRVGEHAEEMAHHFGEAQPLIGPGKAVQYSMLAGEKALEAKAYENAVAQFQKGLSAKGADGMDDDAAALLFGLGRAQASILSRDRMQDAVDTLTKVLDHYLASGDMVRVVAVARSFPNIHWPQGRSAAIARALEHVPGDSEEAGWLLALYGRYLHVERAEFQAAQAALDRALLIAEATGNKDLEIESLSFAAELEAFGGRYWEARQKALKVIELCRGTDSLEAEFVARFWAANPALGLHPDDAETHATAMLEVAEKLKVKSRLIGALNTCARVHNIRGNWVRVRHLLDRALSLDNRSHNTLLRMALLEYQLGSYSAGAEYLERAKDVIGHRRVGQLPMVMGHIAFITGDTSSLDDAKRIAESGFSLASMSPMLESFLKFGMAFASIMRGDADVASRIYKELQWCDYDELWEFPLAHLKALLARSTNETDLAIRHFDETIDLDRRGGFKPDLAWSCYGYAETLMARRQTGDVKRAEALLQESLALSEELGMRPLMDRVMALQDGLASLPPEMPSYPDGLTHREVEVLRLIATGRTDREIADELVISIRTVGRHVSNLLNKTGSANRAGAVAYAAQKGLLEAR